MTSGRKKASERRAQARTDGQSVQTARPNEKVGAALAAPKLALKSDMAAYALQRLEEMIITLELEPGSIWSESELSEKLDIGRTPVREALKRLEFEHLVEIVPRSGARITEVNVMQQLLMLEVRRELERLITTSACRRSTEEERGKCLEIARHFEGIEKLDILYYLRYHFKAMQFLTECAHNAFASRAILPCHALSRRFYYLHHHVIHDVSIAASYHASVFEAVALGDEKRAAEASDTLIDYAEENARRTVFGSP